MTAQELLDYFLENYGEHLVYVMAGVVFLMILLFVANFAKEVRAWLKKVI